MRRPGSIALPDWAAGAGLLVALLLVYSAVLVTPYAVTDDYVHLAGAMRDGRFTFEISMARGCPTSALLSWLGFLAADSLGALRYLRVVGIVGLGLLAYLLYLALRRAGWRPGLAAALALIICSTPPFQVFASWAVTFTAFYSCALTGVACQQGLLALQPGLTRSRAALRVAAALGLLAVTVSMSQLSLMYFVVFAAIDLFRPQADPPRLGRRVVLLGGILAAALVLGFVAYRIGAAAYPSELMGAGRSSLVSQYLAKARYFVEHPLRAALQWWTLSPSDRGAYLAAVATLVGLGLYLRGSWPRRLAMLGLAGALLPAIYAPSLLAAENWGAYRTQIGLSSLLVIYAACALMGYARLARRLGERVAPRLAWAAAVAAGLLAARNVAWYYADAQQTEIHVMRAGLARLEPADTDALRVLTADWTHAVTAVKEDEFGLPSSSQWWALGPMTYVLAHERGLPGALPILTVNPRTPNLAWDGSRQVQITPGAGPREAVVDMTQLRWFAW